MSVWGHNAHTAGSSWGGDSGVDVRFEEKDGFIYLILCWIQPGGKETKGGCEKTNTAAAGKRTFNLCSYLLIWSLKDSSCCFSGAVIISSTSVSCSGSAPLACRDARMASILWDFSSRRLSVKHKYQPMSGCHHGSQTKNKLILWNLACRMINRKCGGWWWTHLLSFVSNNRLAMRWDTVCVATHTEETSVKPEASRDDNRYYETGPSLSAILRLMFIILPYSSSEVAFLQLGAGWRCKDRKYGRERSQESWGFPEAHKYDKNMSRST